MCSHFTSRWCEKRKLDLAVLVCEQSESTGSLHVDKPITFLNNACHLSYSDSDHIAATSPLISDLWGAAQGKVVRVHMLMWYGVGKNYFELLPS